MEGIATRARYVAFRIFTDAVARKNGGNPNVDGDSLHRLMALNHDGNDYVSVLFYASWCPFSRVVRPKFDMLSSMFPQIKHLAVEHSQALPSTSIFTRLCVLVTFSYISLISELGDANGSDVDFIFSFIEVRDPAIILL
ncbi:hypothetical protein HA466_0206110 [Hirschfeldia incana]|nr:hypothetical protein HA466_0206110 [Hirschfeldia incana]